MFELLFLLLPVAAIYGFYMGRSSVRNKRIESKNSKSSDYLRGVDYLLNNDQEKAVDRFIAYLNAADPTFESSLALGNLFRQRGEVDKAIALHERLTNSESTEEVEHELSQAELARDFISAGLLDRAESILLELSEIPRQRKEAARLLLKVYEREQDFKKAIEVALTFRDVLGSSCAMQLGQYYCEKAGRLLLGGETEAAMSSLRSALDVFPHSVRARLELSQLLCADKKYDEAAKLIKEASGCDRHFGLLCLEQLVRCYPNKADPNYRFALEDLVHRTSSAAAMVELVGTVEQSSGLSDATALLLSFIKEHPNLKLFSTLMRLRAKENEGSGNDALLQLKSLIDAQIASNPRFSCTNCGFESRMMFWQCPSCRKWESLRPKIGLDGD